MQHNSGMSSIRVLLVDDHAVVRAGIRNALESVPNLTVVGEVADGADLFPMLQIVDANCLLIDVTMPNFNPIEAVQRIRQLYPELRILVVSAFDDDVYVQGLMNVGVSGYHLKDQPLSDLRLAISKIMSGQRWVSSRLLDKLIGNETDPARKMRLTKRQKQILSLLQRGLDNYGIGREIGISIKTVENHLTRLYRQLDVSSRLEAVNFINKHPQLLSSTANLPNSTSQTTDTLDLEQNIRATVLIVDDNPRYRKQLERTVSRLHTDIAIVQAQNTAEALEAAVKRQPQLALVDVVLGNEEGIVCAERMRQTAPDTRIVMMSAYPDREFRRRASAIGAAAFLDKKDLDSAAIRLIIQDNID